MFDGLKARLERLFAEAGGSDPRAHAALLQEALVEARVGVAGMRDALQSLERELATERENLATAERRGRLAAEVPDPETVAIAERFAVRHRERVALLERKLAVQRDELSLAQRELEAMTAQYREARLGIPQARASANAAWRDIEAAGGTRPETDLDGELLRHDSDRRAHEQAVEQQLAYLKKKLGKDRPPSSGSGTS